MAVNEEGNPGRWSTGLGGVAKALRNGVELARKGRFSERRETPYEVEDRGPHHRLRHYQPEDLAESSPAEPVVLVPPLMLSADLWDIAPDASSVVTLSRMGADPFVVDFGSPEEEEGGLERTLTDHVVAVSAAVDAVHRRSGRPVHLMGYSQGGMFAYQAAAYRQSDAIASIVTFGSGVDLHGGLPARLPTELVIRVLEQMSELQDAVIPEGVPSWATRLGFQLLDPVKTVRQRIQFLATLSDREALEEREDVRRFMETEGWTAFPGPALADLLRQLVAQNRLLQGGLVIDGQTVTLADITCPILAFTGATDAIAPPDTVRAIYAAAPRADCFEVGVDAGHFGLVVGSTSSRIVWPAVSEWLAWRRDEGALPAAAVPLDGRVEAERKRGPFEQLRDAGALSFELGAGVLTGAARGFGLRLGQLERLLDVVSPQAGRLNQLAQIRSGTRVSPGRALAERAASAPEDTFFLFDGRAYSYAAANQRIDNIVRGFVQLGVRHGDHVGVLMQTRPSAVASVVALSRMGAIAVLLRPDLPLKEQLGVARVDHLLSDPESAEAARQDFGRDVFVLGGGGEARTLAEGLVDMEAIDPERVALPDWYEPNPGLAGELAAILISGEGGRLRPTRVTNRRWATSAYGTSSACALTPQDTVYCRTPMHHPTGLLVCVGGALTSGARLAMASEFGPVIAPGDFWRDVRRYGVNVVFYTGAMLRSIVNAPEDPYERHHAIRLVAGSGMPKSLWQRVHRFPSIGVVEFFAPSEGNAVLVNLTGKKIGSIGRPLPGAGRSPSLRGTPTMTGSKSMTPGSPLGVAADGSASCSSASSPSGESSISGRFGASSRPTTPGSTRETSCAWTGTATTGWSIGAPTSCGHAGGAWRPGRSRTPSASGCRRSIWRRPTASRAATTSSRRSWSQSSCARGRRLRPRRSTAWSIGSSGPRRFRDTCAWSNRFRWTAGHRVRKQALREQGLDRAGRGDDLVAAFGRGRLRAMVLCRRSGEPRGGRSGPPKHAPSVMIWIRGL